MDTTLKKDEVKTAKQQREIAPAAGLFGRKMGETGKPQGSSDSDREPMSRAA